MRNRLADDGDEYAASPKVDQRQHCFAIRAQWTSLHMSSIKKTEFRQEAIRRVAGLPAVRDFRRRVLTVCTALGVWIIIKNGGAYKCAKSRIWAPGNASGED